MELDAFTVKVKETPDTITFEDTMTVIEGHFEFTETAFQNGDLKNESGQNSGSCKLFSFAQHLGLTEQQTLQCFGTYYREDVLKDPNGTSHQNIRNFMKQGWAGISFESPSLQAKSLH